MDITGQIAVLKGGIRRVSLLLAAIGCFVLGSFVFPAAAVGHWQMVAQSADRQHAQYVDLDSIAQTGAIVRLHTYWMDQRQPEAKTYAVAEYHCDRQQFRDLELNGEPHQSDWQTIQADPLNAAVMQYVCHH
ncbi:hypothetical protein ACN4EK_12415 [Pantanalinema rosaneae CENA516]|uniref:hypothetical protein n=1 Tax=Pantanalinema rosaneae TaxID=1620701 RepID=UPI003D6FACC0